MNALFHSLRILTATFAAAAFVVSDAGAAVVAPGATVALSGTTSAANPNLAGVVQNDNLIAFSIQNGSGATLVSGNLQNRVVQSTTLGTLIFAPRLRDLNFAVGAAAIAIVGLQVTPYGGETLDIDFRTDGLGAAGPFNVSRSASGDQLTFRYSGLTSNDGSLFPSVLTAATVFSLTGTATIFAQLGGPNGQIFATTLQGLAVPNAVPLPAAAPLFLGALAGVAGLRRRRKTV